MPARAPGPAFSVEAGLAGEETVFSAFHQQALHITKVQIRETG